jgi:hypothetical protein
MKTLLPARRLASRSLAMLKIVFSATEIKRCAVAGRNPVGHPETGVFSAISAAALLMAIDARSRPEVESMACNRRGP